MAGPENEKKIKNGIARKITRRVMLLLLAAMIVLIAGAYTMVNSIVMKENKDYAETLLDIFTDLLFYYSYDNDKAISAENGEDLVRISSLFNDRFDVDYTYLFTFSEEEKSITYSVASFSYSTEHMDPGNHMIGYKTAYTLTPSEYAVWTGEKEILTYSYRNFYGYEITTLKAIRDCTGTVYIAGIDLNYDSVFSEVVDDCLVIVAALAVVLLSVGFALYFFTKKNISQPAQKISRTMQEYISNGSRSDVRLDDSGTDEYAVIAGAFNSMSDDISQYIDNIRTLSVQQAGQQAELEIAAGIQRGFLTSPKAEFAGCSVRAMMNPAKDVGGDLYDYIELDDRRIFVVIADVSGKGISAAMFMSVTLTLLRQFAKMGLSPDEILRQTNDALAEKNSALLFATAFVGIFDSRTGSFTYSNAGHNLPYVVGDSVTVLDGAAGTVLGLYEDETYESKTLRLGTGDTVFLYTDGVTEAVDTEKRFFGDDRLASLLAGFRSSGETDLVDYVYRAVCEFSLNAEQHDDITMLTLCATGGAPSGPKKRTLRLDYAISEFEKIKDAILELPIARRTQLDLCLAAEEVFVNICSYAFEEKPPAGEKIEFTLGYGKNVTLRFSDGGVPFDPLENIMLPDGDGEPTIGGLGRFLYVSLCDEAKYVYNNGRNVLTLVKSIKEEQR